MVFGIRYAWLVCVTAIIGATASASAACPPLPAGPLQEYDAAFYKYAQQSNDPTVWAKYFTSLGCDDQKAVLQRLLYAIVSMTQVAPLFQPSPAPVPQPTPVFAPTAISLTGTWGGDPQQLHPVVGNNQLLDHRKSGGVNIHFFQLNSLVEVQGIPSSMLTAPFQKNPTRALWIE